MSSDLHDSGDLQAPQEGSHPDWERLSAELRACRQSQRDWWGDIDNATLGRYLAGESTDAERLQVEAALKAHPQLQTLADLVREVLEVEADPVPVPPVLEPVASAPEPELEPVPAVLPFSSKGKGPSWLGRLRRRGHLVAAASLLLALGLSIPSPAPRAGLVANVADVERGVARRDAFFAPMVWQLKENERQRVHAWPGLETDAHLVKLDAESSLQQGLSLVEKGDLVRAERLLSRANHLCQQQLGPTHNATKVTVRNLANVYQVALDSPDPNLAGPLPPPPSADLSPALARGYAEPKANYASAGFGRHRSARVLREQIVNGPPQEVRRLVVPVLTQALNQATSNEDRVALLRALGELGPAAKDAVPLLTDCVQNSRTVDERQAAVLALGEIGSAAREAVPALVECLDGPCLESRRSAGKALVQLGPVARPVVFKKLNEKDGVSNDVCRRVLAQLQGVEGRIGINDTADCFNLRTTHEALRLIHHLARTVRLEVLVETLPSAPPAECARENLSRMGALSLHVLIIKKPAEVRLTGSPALQAWGVALKALEHGLKASVREGQYDAGLLGLLRELSWSEDGRRKP